MSRAWAWGLVAALFAGALAFVPAAAQADREVHLIAVGDFGARAATRTVLDGIGAAGPDATLALGDMKYQDVPTEADWCAYVKQSLGQSAPFELIAGNHDSLEPPDADIAKLAACLPNRVSGLSGTYGKEYYLDFPSSADPLVRVIAASPGLRFADGTWSYKAGDAHYQWLNAAIDGGRAAGAKWIVVANHKTCWSVGQHACPTTDFYNLLLSKKVDLVVQGHEHGYMRSHQLTSGVTGCSVVPVGSFDADCVTDTDRTFTGGSGTVFAVAGTGGTPIRNINLADTEAGYFASSSGANLNPSYGYLDLRVGENTIDARFVTTSGGPFTDTFTIGTAAAPANKPPVAAFTSSTSALRADVNGSGSFDPDGSIAKHAWNWGDGTAAGSGAQATHSYASGGTYSVTLTVTDDDGASTSTTQAVTVSGGSTSTVVASDTFTRTLASGLGSAQKGGAYKLLGSASNYAVDGSTGLVTLAPAASRRAVLPAATATAAAASVTFGYSGTLTGGGMNLALLPRVKADNSGYRAKVNVSAAGVAKLSLTRVDAAGADTVIATWSGSVSGFTSAKRLIVRSELTGSSSTTIKAKMWLEGTAEPGAWQLQASNSMSTLQGSGGVGVFAHQSSSATGTIKVKVDNLSSTKL